MELRREDFLARSRILLDEMTEKMLDVVAAAGVTTQRHLGSAGGRRIHPPPGRARPGCRTSSASLPDTSVRPDEAVALGAALFAAQRQLERGGALTLQASARDQLERLTVTDVSAHSLGVSVFEAADGTGPRDMTPLLRRNTALPSAAERTFYTMRPGETRIVVPVLEGESADPELCRRIGVVIIDRLPPGRAAHQPVQVTMCLNTDGILQVSAADVTTGAQASTTIVHAYLADAEPDGADAADRMVQTLLIE